MNRKVTLLYISLACVLSLQAQTRQQMGGVYYAYPEGPSAKTGTFGTATYVLSDSLNVPQGYAPFYISHYGRHGSRWMPKDDRYVWICKHFEDESNLTPLGLQVKGMLQRVWENAKGNGGKLSKLGALQHQGIAHRMFERYPQIFAAGNAVKARSSVVDRCARSMQAFTSELHTLQPGLNLDVKTDSADMAWIAYVSPEIKALENRTHVQAHVSPRRFLLQLFKDVAPDVTGIRFLKEKLGDCLSEETADSMEMIISSVETAKECEFNIKFDPTLVRGQSYYTGTIFEVTMDDFGGSVAGGGRYDKMIGKFTGQDTPACGFSIGFERIVMLLLENGYEVPTVKEKKAYLLEKKMTKEGLLKVMSLAKADRQAGKQVLIVNMKKNKKFQKEQLTEDGYTEIVDCYADSVENL